MVQVLWNSARKVSNALNLCLCCIRPLLHIFPREKKNRKTSSHTKILHLNVHRTFICNSRKLEAKHMSFNEEWIKGYYLYEVTLYPNKKKGHVTPYNLNQSQGHISEKRS